MLTKLSVLNMKAHRNPPKVALIKCTEVGLKMNTADTEVIKLETWRLQCEYSLLLILKFLDRGKKCLK